MGGDVRVTAPAILWFLAPACGLLAALLVVLAGLMAWFERRRWHGCGGGGHWK